MSSEAWKKIACPVSIRHALAHKLSEVLQIIWACTFYFVKKRKTELQIFSRLNKTTSKLQWIPRTAAYLQSFNNVYKSDKTKLKLFIHGMSCIQIMTCIRTGQAYTGHHSNIKKGIFWKNSNFIWCHQLFSEKDIS